MLRYFNFGPCFKLRWCRARNLFGSQIPVATAGFELQISCIRSRYLTHMEQSGGGSTWGIGCHEGTEID